MSILYLEGFDDGLWESRLGGTFTGSNVSSSYGLNGNGVRVGDTPNAYADVPLPGTTDEFTFGMAFKIVEGSVGGDIFDCGATGGYQVVNWTTDNRLYAYINGNPDIHMYSPVGSVNVGEWHYLEVYMKPSTASVGVWKWWLDGTLLDNETGIDFVQNNNTHARLGGTGSTDVNDWYIDNIYVTDTTGSANTAELGPIEVVTLLPTDEGNVNTLVGSDSNSVDNHLLVDNNASAPPATTEYVGSDTEGDKDTYLMGDLTGTPIVAGMVVSLYAAKTDSGAKYMRPIVRTSSTDYNGDSEGLAETYSLHEHTWDQNPNTSAAWLYGAINGMEVGQEVRDS